MESKLAQQVAFNDVLRYVGATPLPEDSYVTCPFCGRPGKFRLYSNGTYHCFRPKCGAHGDIYTYLIEQKYAANYAAAYQIVSSASQQSYGNVRFMERHSRHQALSLLHQQYLEQAQLHPEVLQSFADQRGYSLSLLHQQKVGYSPVGWQPDIPKQLFSLVFPKRHLMQGRLVFPIYDSFGQLEHFQGRSLQIDDPLRWLSTAQDNSTLTIRHFLYNAESYTKLSTLYLCEGITDTLSLLELGLPAVGTVGLHIPLNHTLFAQTQVLVAYYDGDRHEDGQYKSWSVILPQLIKLQQHYPTLDIYCATPTEPFGDLNEWLSTKKLNRQSFIAQTKQRMQPLSNWAVQLLYKDFSKHKLLLELCQVTPSLKEQLSQALMADGIDAVTYALQVLSD